MFSTCFVACYINFTFVFDNSVKFGIQMVNIGIDIGSTTAKIVVLDEQDKIIFSAYKRHNAKVKELLISFMQELQSQRGDIAATINITGSVGMGISEKCSFQFVQEVIAATKVVQRYYPNVKSMIDIGGEDAKVVFFNDGKATDLRMNGNCAGGTGAFIDQMAILLGVPTEELNQLAQKAKNIHPIASRCGVFSKTDIQNLIAKNVSKEDIAASVFHAVAVQVIVTLAHGYDIEAPVLFCGGPFTFLPALRQAFKDYLRMRDDDIITPPNSHLIPALGAALSADKNKTDKLSSLITHIQKGLDNNSITIKGLDPIFKNEEDYQSWKDRMSGYEIREAALTPGKTEITLGIDSGSTTTKIVALNKQGEIVFHYYHNNDGNPIATVQKGLKLFQNECKKNGTELIITGSCSTGYGEDLIKASFRLDHGIIETIAHYMAARHLTDKVSFILDIGGQDMKAIFINDGVINRIEINEACSSGCGSFIETFSKSLGYNIEEFSHKACEATSPYDLGTRCTVFMNSKVKQALREGATINDIAAGLSYSVIKNCLYKVLRLKNTEELGNYIVVQGGTMKNDSVVHAFEKLTGHDVYRCNHPELMGAIGCALYARQQQGNAVSLEEILDSSDYTTQQQQCHGCENQCLVTAYRFNNGNRYFSGNRCEKIFTNKGTETQHGTNAYKRKLELLFDRKSNIDSPIKTIGIPRCLNMYEEYPFWHTLFTQCNIEVVLSDASTFTNYETSVKQVMSDNICFPAKLAHSHIQNLIDKNVDRIFMPFVVYEKIDGGQNSYNCPIVSGYTEVIKGVRHGNIPIDSPVISFKNDSLLFEQCCTYLEPFGISRSNIKKAFKKAIDATKKFEMEMTQYNKLILEQNRDKQKLTILLAGRPYHSDPLIQHKLSDMIAAMGVDVITEDTVRGLDIRTDDVNFISQWAYTNRILKAAEWAAEQDNHIQFMQMTSFGCGPDAFLTDETHNLLKRHGKTLTLLKIDDVSNLGSLKLRVRSVIESLKLSMQMAQKNETLPFVQTPIFTKKDRYRKIIAPFFTPFISPLVPSIMKLAGYDVESLPVSDEQSCEWGLKYANNEVCYPATLIVGDIVKAFKSGKYDPHDTAVIITQTGGQCRASNYISLIKKALTESGFENVPVISLTANSGINNNQPGFKINWIKILPIVIPSLLYSDCLAKFYYASVVREKEKGMAKRLLDYYMNAAIKAIQENNANKIWDNLSAAAQAFDEIVLEKETPQIGIVGEIYLKFNPFAQKDITSWLTEQGIEVIPPLLTDFFMQSFVNAKANKDQKLTKGNLPDIAIRWIYNKVEKQFNRANTISRQFRYFMPFESIFSKAEEANKVISLCAQFGEGWLLPGEILSMSKQGVRHVISLQPFGCIANHIVAKGMEKRIKDLYPGINLLSLDFDSGVSDVNIRNRILLFIDNLKK